MSSKIDFSPIYHLSKIGNMIMESHEVLKKLAADGGYLKNNEEDSDLIGYIFQSNMVLWSVSFMDEWNKYFNDGRIPGFRVNELKACLKPVTKELAKWREMNKFRNEVIAHNFRQNGQSIFLKENRLKYAAPADYFEVAHLIALIKFLTVTIESYYAAQLEHFKAENITEEKPHRPENKYSPEHYSSLQKQVMEKLKEKGFIRS